MERSHLYCVLATWERGFLVFKPSTDPEKAVGCSGETCGCCMSPRESQAAAKAWAPSSFPSPRGRRLERSWLVPAQCYLAWSVTSGPRCPPTKGNLSVTARWHGLALQYPVGQRQRVDSLALFSF